MPACKPPDITTDELSAPRRSQVKGRRPRRARISLAKLKFEQDLAIVEPAGNLHWAYRLTKRTTDIFGALCLLILLGPAMLATFVALTITTRGRPVYTQMRVGYLGRKFRMVKFRTMRVDADQMKHLVVNEATGPIFKNRRDPRITRIGRFLRMTSIDETPQLVHVLTGHMSLVGPRPMVVKEVSEFEPWQRRKLSVKPGLTCLWQISGRSEIGFLEWMRMDLWYSKRQSLWTDMKLLIKTPWKVITGKGAY